MAGIFRSWGRGAPRTYEHARLVDRRRLARPSLAGVPHLICDIDKTYLESEFESLSGMARIAFESASAKITVAGAADVLVAARWGELGSVRGEDCVDPVWPRSLHFVSSSPPQLRAVLEEKLALDGLDWDSDTFKNQAYNLRMGRVDLLRQHVAYKTRAIAELVREAAPETRFFLFGDNAESDGFIYTGLRLWLDGRLSLPAYRAYLEAAGVEPAVAQDVTRSLPIPRGSRIEAMLIRQVPGYESLAAPPLTDVLLPFEDFFQASLLLVELAVIPVELVWELTRRFHNQHAMPLVRLDAALAVLAGSSNASAAAAAQAARAALPEVAPVVGATRVNSTGRFAESFGRDTRAFLELGEEELIAGARLWCQRLAERRERGG